MRHGLRREIIRVASHMTDLGVVSGTGGNVSVRDGGVVIVTPTRRPYAELRHRDLVRVDLRTGELLGPGTPSLEVLMHLEIYRARPDVSAIVHTHSAAATAWSFLGIPLGPATEEQAYLGIGPVRCCPPAPAGTEHLARGAVTALGCSLAALLGEHGVVAVGATPGDALTHALAVERHAEVAWWLRLDGRRSGTPESVAVIAQIVDSA